jgi:hypothetical protein
MVLFTASFPEQPGDLNNPAFTRQKWFGTPAATSAEKVRLN